MVEYNNTLAGLVTIKRAGLMGLIQDIKHMRNHFCCGSDYEAKELQRIETSLYILADRLHFLDQRLKEQNHARPNNSGN